MKSSEEYLGCLCGRPRALRCFQELLEVATRPSAFLAPDLSRFLSEDPTRCHSLLVVKDGKAFGEQPQAHPVAAASSRGSTRLARTSSFLPGSPKNLPGRASVPYAGVFERISETTAGRKHPVGLRFWRALQVLLSGVEQDLAMWYILRVRLDTRTLAHLFPPPDSCPSSRVLDRYQLDERLDLEQYAAFWGKWAGREREFFEECGC
jgi:hypothetical protein